MSKVQSTGGVVRRQSVCLAVMETLDVRRLLSAALGSGHTHEHDISPIDPALVNVWAPTTVSLTRPGTYLTPARKDDADTVLRTLLRSNVPRLGTTRTTITNAQITDRYTDSMSGLTHVYYRQTYNGLPILNALANGSVDASGRVLAAAANFIQPLPVTKSAAREVLSPKVSAIDAVEHVAEALGVELGGLGFAPYLGTSPIPKSKTHLHGRISAPGLQAQPIETNLVYVATGDRKVELAWRMEVELENGAHWYELAVSATTGEVIFAADYVSHATYNVLSLPTKAPNDGPRSLRTDPHDTLASPFGWHDTDGVAGPEFTITRGNNVHAYLDRDNNNAPDATTFDGRPGLTFNPCLDLTAAPTTLTNQHAALTNLFYVNNRIHDITYRYGFTEVAGNFQTNNYGRGGLGNDAVRAQAQDGGGTNNANFATPTDGNAPRMQMYLWTQTTPQRDGDLDNLIIIHEYTHGISNRLTGGPANSSALSATQSGGMGEGWSDFFSLMLTQKPTDTATQGIGVGTFSLGQSTSGLGIRRYPYSTDLSINPLTVGSYNSTQLVHRTGEIWCATLWDLNWALIGVYGPTTNLAAGYAGPQSGGSALTLQLVMDAMKLQPANPTLFQARDAILQADLNLTGGANQGLIWQTFARRGFGFSASTASSSSVVEAFDVPTPFSLSEDLISLTGPTGNNLRPALTAATWSAGDTVLTFQLTPQTRTGPYTLVLGPNIAAKDTGLPIDQNLDGIGGTPQDHITVVLNYSPYLGPDASGYLAGPALFENLDLIPGQPGVIDTGLSADDSSVAIPLGSNTFNFYGTTYTASQLFANSNGLITFGSGTTAYANTDLTSSPTQPAIAVLWDDWRTDVNANDRLLYRFDDLDSNATADRLILEWSEVINYTFTGSPATFQAILELNTGNRPGSITLNYPGLDVAPPEILTAAAGALQDLAGNRTLSTTTATFRIGNLGPEGPRPLARGLPPATQPPAFANPVSRPLTSFFSATKVGPLPEYALAESAA